MQRVEIVANAPPKRLLYPDTSDLIRLKGRNRRSLDAFRDIDPQGWVVAVSPVHLWELWSYRDDWTRESWAAEVNGVLGGLPGFMLLGPPSAIVKGSLIASRRHEKSVPLGGHLMVDPSALASEDFPPAGHDAFVNQAHLWALRGVSTYRGQNPDRATQSVDHVGQWSNEDLSSIKELAEQNLLDLMQHLKTDKKSIDRVAVRNRDWVRDLVQEIPTSAQPLDDAAGAIKDLLSVLAPNPTVEFATSISPQAVGELFVEAFDRLSARLSLRHPRVSPKVLRRLLVQIGAEMEIPRTNEELLLADGSPLGVSTRLWDTHSRKLESQTRPRISDYGDVLHGLYLPYCERFFCDSRTSTYLYEHKRRGNTSGELLARVVESRHFWDELEALRP